MKTLISGLIVVSLVSHPTLGIDNNPYEIIDDGKKIVYVVKDMMPMEIITSNSIEQQLADIEERNRLLKVLIDQKNKLLGKISLKMELLSQSKKSFTKDQISGYQNFLAFLKNEEPNLKDYVERLEAGETSIEIKNELLKNNADYFKISVKLFEIKNYLDNVVESMRAVVFQSKGYLATI